MQAAALLSLTLLLLVSVPVRHTSALGLPEYIKPCSKNDPNLDDCSLKSAVAAFPFFIGGDRKYNVPPLDDLKVSEIKVRRADGSNGFGITFKDVSILGLKETVLKETKFNLPKKEALIKARVPVVQILGKYEVDGKILLLAIKGSGDSNITLVDVDLDVIFHWELEKRDDGKEYMKPMRSEIKYDLSRAYMRLDGLFGNDKLLGDNMNMFLNENWKDVVKEIGPAVAEALAAVITQIMSAIARIVPYNEIFLEKV